MKYLDKNQIKQSIWRKNAENPIGLSVVSQVIKSLLSQLFDVIYLDHGFHIFSTFSSK